MQPFRPAAGLGKNLDVTDTSARVEVLGGEFKEYLITNRGSKDFFFKLGGGSVVATADADCCLRAGAQIVVTRETSQTHIAAVCDSTDTSTLHVIPGRGY